MRSTFPNKERSRLKVVVEIVAYGPGVGMLKRPSAAGVVELTHKQQHGYAYIRP